MLELVLMEVIPVINCPDFSCVKEKAKQARELGAEWVHLDVADGIFTKEKTWNNPEDLEKLAEELDDLKIEAHLMVADPASAMDDWLYYGVDRVIIHFEAIEDGWEIICDRIEREGRELGIAIAPETPVRVLEPYLKAVTLVQLLAVTPGPAGQNFNPVILEKLKEIKKREPDVEVEIDGGINPETAALVKKAGADIVVSASYIWKNKDPQEAFEKLRDI